MADVGTVRIYRPDPGSRTKCNATAGPHFLCAASLATRVAVAVMGDIDATNGRALGHYVERHTGISRQLMLDLRAVDFFGGKGFTALYYIAVHCSRNDVDWMIIGSHPVRRLLSICDAEGELPLADDLPAALARLDRLARCRHHVAPAG